MSTSVNPRRATFEHRLFFASVLLIFAVVVAGFARTYYLKGFFGTPALPWLVHLHGALMTAWFVLFFAQIALIASDRVAWHRRLGVIGAGLALAILVLAPIVLVRATSRELGSPQGHQGFVVIFGMDLVVLADFAILVATAIALVLRGLGAAHKRLMLLAACSITLPGISRLPIAVSGIFGIFYALILVPVVVDTARHRRLHPAFAWGAPLLIATQRLAYAGATTHAWHDFVMRLFTH